VVFIKRRWQRRDEFAMVRLGDLAKAQGNLPEAQRLFTEALRMHNA
jgi:hypothetical protein